MAHSAPLPDHAVLVALDFGASDPEAAIAEACELVDSAGAAVCVVVRGRREKPDAALFAGRGKVEEIAEAVAECDAKWVIFNNSLSPIQIRNLERELNVRVMDRTDLILDIFAQRARSHEGKLQVELARLEHHLTRLVRGWTHLERQRGGIGVRGGPGETQLEIDRRLVADRIKLTKERIAKVARQRHTQQGGRRRSGIRTVAIVGYTNAGKSTLFNRLTRAETYVADQLFATLDTTTRKVYLGPGVGATLSDTVGFIRDLPHALVAAFRATLEETANADLLLHVVDASSPRRDGEIDDVNAVLKEIGAEQVPQLLVYNKIDLLPAAEASVGRDECGKIKELRISAVTGQGLEALRAAILSRLQVSFPQSVPVPAYGALAHSTS